MSSVKLAFFLKVKSAFTINHCKIDSLTHLIFIDIFCSEKREAFDYKLMKNFYDKNFEYDEATLNTWYIYVKKFLPLVNKQWREATSSDRLYEQESMFQSITVSDEALVRWFIELWYLHEKKNEDDNRATNKKQIGKGPHDTKHNIELYKLIHLQLEDARDKYSNAVKWNNLFWKEVKKRHETKSLTHTRTNEKDINGLFSRLSDLPLPGLNKNQKFLASFTEEKYETANAILDLSPSKKAQALNYTDHPITPLHLKIRNNTDV